MSILVRIIEGLVDAVSDRQTKHAEGNGGNRTMRRLQREKENLYRELDKARPKDDIERRGRP